MANYVWVSVNDNSSCETCIGLNGEVDTLENWQATGEPRVRDTECNGNCRCDLINDSWTKGDIEQEMQKAIDEGFAELMSEIAEGIRINVTKGGLQRDPITLKQYRDIEGITTLTLETIADHQISMIDWKRKNNFKKLPDNYYRLNDIQKQIDWFKVNP